MRRQLAISLSAGVAALFLCTSLWFSAGRTTAAAPPRTPVWATETVQAEQANPALAAIALYAPGAPATAWTVVQWQDGLGGWHDVEGWRGELDQGQQKVWWVLGKDLNTGPFRWVVFNQRDGTVWGISEAFNLPGRQGQWVRVSVVP